MLQVSNLRVSYGGVLALSDVSLEVQQGSIVALVGGNGNGKSTTLRAIAGLNQVDAGSVRFDGRPVHELPAHQRVPLGLSLVPEGRRLFPRLSVRRNLELGAFTRTDAHEVAAGIDEMFTLFPILKERETQLAGTMSGGEQQMLAIARGLMAKPKLLMLDEPSWGIAPKFVAKVLEVIQRVNETGVTILLVKQNLHKALSIAHHGYVIQTGRIVMQGSGAELAANDDVKKAYLGL
ncbi:MULTISPECIES: ABC transporter ATP-binding protein [unclassified Rhizobacter]|uniref:ABC transporter ATP-binding protein n=1 Tax=unclassified Rhizobacter TaxID=2640088 RepID=UPI0006FEAD7A|nr:MULTISPECIES: ABC transporter ATP-binding protein [unclassified Rhizobacter]KQU74647.1 ABC transporter ATP-binding protein [Rhizobacter sp. Root29]KQW13520.1 ABC transporter ATP-binding protein [Rhizobacter sp. Root1238]KRB23129.1 ABC transporter ATP-binding protein [Rhizobacter sp. Root16D2]